MKLTRKTGMPDEGAEPPSEDDPAGAPSIAPRKASNGKPQGEPGGAGGGRQGQGEGTEEQHPQDPGPAESSGRLWVPGR